VATTAFKKRFLSSKPNIDIFIPDTKPYYSTLETISGSVTVTVKQPTPFSDITINLVGSTQCSVDNPNASGGHSSSDAVHRFLGVSQPIPEDALPLPLVLQPGQTYTFPFSFVVPTQMLPRACSHSVNSQPVREAHLQLPPSLDQGSSSIIFGGRVNDCVKITYAIKARITRVQQPSGHKIAIAEANRTVNIRPCTEELPPLDVDAESSASNVYCLRKESTIRRGLVCTKQGRLSFAAAQPRSFRLSPEPGAVASTYLRALLRFDPATDAALPPRLGTLTSKLCVTTHWATAVRHDFPGLQKKEAVDRTRDLWSDAMPLASLSVENVEWTKHDPSASPVADRDHDHLRPQSALSSVSGLSGDSSQCGSQVPPSGAYREGGVFYTAQVLVPLSLPQGKELLPTFHTCLVSRVYALRIGLSLGHRRICAGLELCVPVQVSAAGGEALAERQRQEELAAQAVTDADQVFEPRLLTTAGMVAPTTVVVPEIRLRRTASGPAEEPPDYEVLSYGSVATRRRVAVHV
jgi:hypothetical protein